MPSEGIQLSPKSHIMTYDEIFSIAKTFVDHGVTKIRLTGGEPLIRKDFHVILEKLATLPVELAITTNGVIVDRFIEEFKKHHIKHINVSLDSLNFKKFKEITRRNYFERVLKNIHLLLENGFIVKLNVVLIKGFNDDEILDFIQFTKDLPISLRFIEFMPFDGNKWGIEKMISYNEIMNIIGNNYDKDLVIRLKDDPNDTSKNYKIKGYKGGFAVISSITNYENIKRK